MEALEARIERRRTQKRETGGADLSETELHREKIMQRGRVNHRDRGLGHLISLGHLIKMYCAAAAAPAVVVAHSRSRDP